LNSSILVKEFKTNSGFIMLNFNDDYLLIGTFQTIEIYNMKTFELNFNLTAHLDWVTQLIKLEVNNQIISSSYDKTIKIWTMDSLKSNKSIRILEGHKQAVLSLVLINNEHLASGSYKEIKIWNYNNGKLIKTLNEKDNWITSLVVLHYKNDNILVSASYDNVNIKVWHLDRDNNELIKTIFKAHTGIIWSVIRLSNSTWASCSQDKTIKVWDLKDLVIIKQNTISSNPKPEMEIFGIYNYKMIKNKFLILHIYFYLKSHIQR